MIAFIRVIRVNIFENREVMINISRIVYIENDPRFGCVIHFNGDDENLIVGETYDEVMTAINRALDGKGVL